MPPRDLRDPAGRAAPRRTIRLAWPRRAAHAILRIVPRNKFYHQFKIRTEVWGSSRVISASGDIPIMPRAHAADEDCRIISIYRPNRLLLLLNAPPHPRGLNVVFFRPTALTWGLRAGVPMDELKRRMRFDRSEDNMHKYLLRGVNLAASA